jgi:hypothetical protein
MAPRLVITATTDPNPLWRWNTIQFAQIWAASAFTSSHLLPLKWLFFQTSHDLSLRVYRSWSVLISLRNLSASQILGTCSHQLVLESRTVFCSKHALNNWFNRNQNLSRCQFFFKIQNMYIPLMQYNSRLHKNFLFFKTYMLKFLLLQNTRHLFFKISLPFFHVQITVAFRLVQNIH